MIWKNSRMPAFAGLTMMALCLSACVGRPEADAKLTRGCSAAIEAFLPDGRKIKEVKQSAYADSAEQGSGYRVVKLDYVETDGWAETDKSASCVFVEQFGFLGMNYTAHIDQLKVDDIVVGKDDGQIVGSYEDNLKLTEKVDNAMNGM